MLLLRGVVAILFGILTLMRPGITLAVLVLLFGAYCLADGILYIIAAFRGAERPWLMVLGGLLSISAGVATFLWPGITAIALLYLIAFWAITTGIVEIAAGVQLRKEITNEWLFYLMGVVSVLFGLLILFAPVAGALAVAGWVAAYALIFGIMMVAFAFRVRGFRRRLEDLEPHRV